jgi:NAD(P)-dependent dehydrogenase (short-subunit alcohol dehydrogenase family)
VERPSRIVNVVSAGQNPIDFDDVMLEHSYDGYRAYAQSKLAEVMLTFDLAEEFEGTGVTANCPHPASHMDTAMVRAAGIKAGNSVDTGAEAVIALFVHNDLTSPSGGISTAGAKRARTPKLTTLGRAEDSGPSV